MDTKAAFDKYLKDQGINPVGWLKDEYWDIWQASRAAIEIELPDKLIEEDYYDGGYNCAIKYCSQAITSHGIRIKGKTE